MIKDLTTVEDFVLDFEFREWVLKPTSSSNKYWKEWLTENPSKIIVCREAANIIRSIGRVDYPLDKDHAQRIWDNIENGLDTQPLVSKRIVPLNPESVLGGSIGHKKNRAFKPKYYSIAASIILLISFLFIVSKWGYSNLGNSNAESTVLKQNPKGQKSTILLPDGTKLTLNSESTLWYGSDYNQSERRVFLEGEAYFDVSEDKSRPFTVQTEALTTTALGTVFNVKAYEGQTQEVVLLSGKVRVNKTNNTDVSEILLPGQKAFLNTAGGLGKVNTSAEVETSWKDGIIYFQDTPFDEGIEELERWYAVEIEVIGLPENINMEFTGRFDNDYLSNVLSSLAYTLKFDYEIDGKNVTIEFKDMPM